LQCKIKQQSNLNPAEENINEGLFHTLDILAAPIDRLWHFLSSSNSNFNPSRRHILSLAFRHFLSHAKASDVGQGIIV
jgi:hypothetical protein